MAHNSAVMNVMIKAARQAARGLQRDFGEVEALQVSRKGAADFVSAADTRAEQVIFEELSRARPKYGFIMEERGEIDGADNSNRWVVDPLDGTIPYSLGCLDWGVNLGYVENGKPTSGAIYLPASGQLLQADARVGCTLNDRPIAPKEVCSSDRFVLGLDLHYATDPAFVRDVLVPLIPQVRLTRSLGSTAALTVDFALGRTDAHLNLRGGGIWDIVTLGTVAAAQGYAIADLAGHPRNWRDGTTAVVASCDPEIAKQILERTRAFISAGD